MSSIQTVTGTIDSAQLGLTLRGSRQREDACTPHQRFGHALTHVTTTDDQDPLATKASRQGTKRGLV